MSQSSARRALTVASALLVLLAVVALGSRGHIAGGGGGETRRSNSGPVIEYVLLVLIVLALVEFPLIAIGLIKSKEGPDMLPKRGNWLLRVFATMTLFAVVFIAVAYWRHSHDHASTVAKPPPGGTAPPVKKPRLAGGKPVDFDWAPVIVVFSIAVGGAAIGGRSAPGPGRRVARRAGPRAQRPPRRDRRLRPHGARARRLRAAAARRR